jgi:hypothetical protein
MGYLHTILAILATEGVFGDNTSSASATVNKDVIYVCFALVVFIIMLGTFCYLKNIGAICMMEDEELNGIQGRKAQPGDEEGDELDRALDARVANRGGFEDKVPQKIILPPLQQDVFDLEAGHQDGPRNSVTLADVREQAKKKYLANNNGGFPLAFTNPTIANQGLTCPNQDCQKQFSSMAALHRHFIISHPEANRKRLDYTKTFTIGWCLFLRNVVILICKTIFWLSRSCHQYYPEEYPNTCHATDDSFTMFLPKCAMLWDDIDCYGLCDIPSASCDCYWLPTELPMRFALNTQLFQDVITGAAKTAALFVPWVIFLPFVILLNGWNRIEMALEVSAIEHPDTTVFLYPIKLCWWCFYNFFYNIRMDILHSIKLVIDILCMHIAVDVYEAPAVYVDPRDRWAKKRGPCMAVYDTCCCVIPTPRLRPELDEALSKIPQGRKRVFIEFRETEWPRALQVKRDESDAKYDEEDAKLQAKASARKAKWLGLNEVPIE